MRILLIRHAEPDYTVDSLTPKGQVEAELLSRRLIRYDIRDFYVSPLGRAKDTAACTLDKLGRKAETLLWLREFRGSYPDPETGNRIRIDFDSVEASFVKLVFTMSTAARTMGAQAAEICIY